MLIGSSHGAVMEYEPKPDEPVSMAVVRAVSSFEDRPETSLPPLHDAINPDALDALFASGGETADRSGSVSFVFSDSAVTVDEAGHVIVEAHTSSSRKQPC